MHNVWRNLMEAKKYVKGNRVSWDGRQNDSTHSANSEEKTRLS